MKSQLHAIAMVLFAICFLYDIVVWGGVTSLPGVGPGIADSARRDAPLATTYIAIGTPLDEALPSLGDYATARSAIYTLGLLVNIAIFVLPALG